MLDPILSHLVWVGRRRYLRKRPLRPLRRRFPRFWWWTLGRTPAWAWWCRRLPRWGPWARSRSSCLGTSPGGCSPHACWSSNPFCVSSDEPSSKMEPEICPLKYFYSLFSGAQYFFASNLKEYLSHGWFNGLLPHKRSRERVLPLFESRHQKRRFIGPLFLLWQAAAAMIENFFTLSETHLRGLFLARTTPTLLPLLSLAFFAQPRLMRRNRVRMNFLTHMFPKTHFDCKKIVLDIILCHCFAYYFTHVDPFLCLAIWTIL